MRHDVMIGCGCHELGHTMRLTYWDDELDDFMYVHYHLEKESFLKRVWAAIKHIFGHRSKFGEFGELCLPQEEVQKIYTVCLSYLIAQEQLDSKLNRNSGTPGKRCAP